MLTLKQKFIPVLLFVSVLAVSIQMVMAQNKKISVPPTRILFLFDASQSMMAKWQSDTKYSIAKKMLSHIIDSLNNQPNLQMALRVYGHQKKFPPQDCNDTKLEVPFAYANGYKITRRLNELKPSGTTPIALTLEACADDFPQSSGRNLVILLTDGIEECGGDPCAVSAALQKKGIVVKPFVIGLGVSKDISSQFNCIGQYFDAQNEEQFRKALNVVISQALNTTTCQVNLLDIKGNPTESNVPMTFYDAQSGKVAYEFVHTLNAKGFPDTLYIDALNRYNIVAHTIPQVKAENVKLEPGKHTIIGIDAPQGDLFLKFDGASDYRTLKCIVRQSGKNNTLHVQDFNASQRYLVGKYDLEVLCLPRMHIQSVSIDQSKTTTVQIPNPGIITVLSNSPGYGCILEETETKLNWVVHLDDRSTKQTFLLQPGNYRIEFRARSSHESEFTIVKPIKVSSGSSSTIELY